MTQPTNIADKVSYDLPPGIPQPNLGTKEQDKTAPAQSDDGKKSFYARKIGAFWVEEDKKKNKYLSGTIRRPDGREERVYLFQNKKKVKESYPDWELFLAEDEYQMRLKERVGKGILD